MTSAISRSNSDAEGGGSTIREHLAATWCEMRGRPLMCAKNALTGQAILYRPNCKQWKCPYCGPQRGLKFMVQAAVGCEELQSAGEKVAFWTITSHENSRSTLQGIKSWRRNWPKLLRRIKRANKFVCYLQIPEQHKKGGLHLHMLTTATTSERWLKDNARLCGFGYIADVDTVIDGGHAAKYVSKYLTKKSHQLQWPKYFRRVNMSRNWPKLQPLPKNENWAIERLSENRSVQRWVSILKAEQWAVECFTE